MTDVTEKSEISEDAALIGSKTEKALIDLTGLLSDIALARLSDAGKGFYNIDILFPSPDELLFRGEAGLSFGGLFKISAAVNYRPYEKTFDAGLRLSGEFKL